MHKVIVEATNPETPRVVRKLHELKDIPTPGKPFYLKDQALDGLVIAEEVTEATDEMPCVAVIYVRNACLDRMLANAGWSEESLAA